METRSIRELASRIAASPSAQRVLATTTLTLDAHGKQALAVDVFSTRMEAKIPNPIYIDPETNEALTSQSNWIAQDTGELLDESQLSSYYTYAGKNVTLTKDDIRKIKAIYPAGLQLLGFKPIDQLADYHNLKPAVLIRPNEKRITGSSLIMNALIDRCSAKDVFMVARMNLRDVQVPRIVALLPQQQQVNERGDIIVAAGFNGVVLPYANDIRTIPDIPISNDMPSLALVDKAIAICKEFQIEQYSPMMYDNPHLARFYETLRTLALNRPEQDTVEDQLTVPEPRQSRPLFDDFVRSVFGDEYEMMEALSGKRPKKPASTESRSKRTRPSFNPDDPDFESLYANNQLSALTVAQLRIYLRDHGLPSTGTKAALIDRISSHISLV